MDNEEKILMKLSEKYAQLFLYMFLVFSALISVSTIASAADLVVTDANQAYINETKQRVGYSIIVIISSLAIWKYFKYKNPLLIIGMIMSWGIVYKMCF